jgi:FdhD protein
MARSRSKSVLVRRRQAGELRRVPDELAVEEPMEIRLDGHRVTTTMRTPGHDYELAVGFCHAEGLLAGMPVIGVRYCADAPAVETYFNVVTVETGGRAPVPTARLTTTTSSCGLCGSDSLTELSSRLAPIAGAAFDLDVLAGVPDRIRALQPLFLATGAVHGAAAVDLAGEPIVVREDIGRHNAVDKVVGRLLLDGRLPADNLALYVSGRASFELVQKAWAAGFVAMIAVSAPSSLAVEAARSAGITLVGFARGDRLNIYSPA